MPMFRGLKSDGGPIYLTQEGLNALKVHLARLKASLPQLIEETARTAAYGDRSENAEYKDAKGKLRSAHRQIFEIEDRLKRVVLIEAGSDPSGSVRIGSKVILEGPAGIRTFEIVGPHETDPGAGRISHLSPLGAALMRKKAGDMVAIPAPHGSVAYLIREVG